MAYDNRMSKRANFIGLNGLIYKNGIEHTPLKFNFTNLKKALNLINPF